MIKRFLNGKDKPSIICLAPYVNITTKLIFESSDIPSAGKKRTVSRYLCCIPGSSSPFSRGTFIVFWLAGCGFMDVRIFSTFFRRETRLLLSRMAFRMLCRSSGDTIPDKEKHERIRNEKCYQLSNVKRRVQTLYVVCLES